MTTRSAALKPDRHGQFSRQLGWKLSTSGKRTQHKFRLGNDRREAEQRIHLLRQLWEVVELRSGDDQALWDEPLLEIAKQVASGNSPVQIAPEGPEETAKDYHFRIVELGLRYPFLRFTATDKQHCDAGLGSNWPDMKKFVFQQLDHFRHYDPAYFSSQSGTASASSANPQPSPAPGQPGTPPCPDQTLHTAFDAFEDWIRSEHLDVERDEVTEHGLCRLRRVKSLKDRHDDVLLSELDFEAVEQIYRFWRQRPHRKPQGNQRETSAPKRLSPHTVRHLLAELNSFFKWLHRSSRFAWRKPEDFDDINRRQVLDAGEARRQLNQVETFTLADLQLLNRYATPMERLWLLLALNCGFGAKEIATLTIGEVDLYQALPDEQQQRYDFPSTNADSFVSVVRSKSAVAGKYVLFQQTAQMLDWIRQRRMTQPNPASEQPLILNEHGQPLDQRTKSGNRSAQIPNRFNRLKQRIVDDGHSLTDLSFKYLRKTAGDLIRRASDGEIAGVFLLHGKPVKSDTLSDVYTNRPFGKVFGAIRHVEETLQPVFAEVKGDPTLKQPETAGEPASQSAIAIFHGQGLSIRQIAKKTGKSRMAVQREITRLREIASTS